MYVSITGNKDNQDVYIKQSYRKDNGKTSSRIYRSTIIFWHSSPETKLP